MSKKIEIAAVHFQAAEDGPDIAQTVYRQFAEARRRLDGTHLDLAVFCEGMSSRGQTVGEAESPERPGRMFELYREFAVANHCVVAGAIKLQKSDRVYNSLIYLDGNGKFLGDYDKTHLTDGELAAGMTPGKGARVVTTPVGRLGGVICFDLNFDDLRLAYAKQRPDIICFSSMYHGGFLQQNWAYRCRAFWAAACKDYTSSIIDPLGRVMAETDFYGRIARATVNLDYFVMHQDHNVDKFADIRREYGPRVKIDYASDLATAVLYSECEESAAAIAARYGLTEIDGYLFG